MRPDGPSRLHPSDRVPADAERYKHLLFGAQGTGGSTVMASSFEQMRQAGATARHGTARAMLEAAAAGFGATLVG